MTECNNADMRDLLPDFVAETMSAADAVRVRAHLSTCAPCSAEVALLRIARAVRPVAAAVNVGRIVAALPARASAPLLELERADRPARPVRKLSPAFSGVWRMAAAIGIAALGGWSVLAYRTSSRVPGSATPPVAAGVGVPASTTPDLAPTQSMPARETVAVAPNSVPSNTMRATDTTMANGTSQRLALSLGDLSEYSDDDLQRMLDRLDKWDGATAAEPVPTVPLVPVSERGAL